ncbi:hypothetical protein GW17_00061939, partial [Ensete ventricosum]
ELKLGINPGDLAENVNSGTNLENLAEKVNSSTNPRDLAEKVNSGTNPGDLVERVNSGINSGDLAEKVNSGTNLGDSTEKVNSSTNPRNLAERVNSGKNPGDLAEMVNSSTNSRDLAEKVNPGKNPEDLAERVGMTSSDSSSSVRVISSLGSGGVSQGDPEDNSLRVSSGPPSLVDARVLRDDMEVMKVDHDLVTTVTEGSLAVIRGRYSIQAEYGWHVPRPGQRPYMCITVDALKAGLWFPLHPLIEDRGGYYLTARVGFWVSEVPSNNKGWKSHYLFMSGPVWGFRLNWSAHPIDNASPYLSEEEFILVGRLKGIRSSSCTIKEMTELWLVKADQMDLDDLHGMPKMSSGKAPSTRAATPAREVGVSPAREAPKTLSKRSIDVPTEQADDPAWRHKKVKVLTRRHKSRHGEGESRSHSKGKEPAASSEEPDTPAESDEGDALLKEARVRARKMDDELLQAVKALENARAELPRQAVDRYKESASFKEGLKRMGRVTYEYGYRVALARFHSLHPDSEVEEDPFTIHPEDDLVPIERQQAFDDSDPPES